MGDVELDRARPATSTWWAVLCREESPTAEDVADEDRRGWDGGMPQLHADPGDEHLGRDRLDDVVVGADAECGDVRSSRSSADTMMMGDGRPHVQLPAQLDTVDVGQAEIEQDEVVIGSVSAASVPAGRHRPVVTWKPRAVRARSPGLVKGRIVLDDQDCSARGGNYRTAGGRDGGAARTAMCASFTRRSSSVCLLSKGCAATRGGCRQRTTRSCGSATCWPWSSSNGGRVIDRERPICTPGSRT